MSGEMLEAIRAEMAVYVRDENELKVKLGLVEEKLKGPEEKLAKAKELVLKAKAAYDQILEQVQPLRSEKTLLEGEIQIIQEKKSELRHQAQIERGGGAAKPGAELLLEQMKQMGADPLEAQMKRETAQAEANAALEGLKTKMGL